MEKNRSRQVVPHHLTDIVGGQVADAFDIGSHYVRLIAAGPAKRQCKGGMAAFNRAYSMVSAKPGSNWI